MQNKVVTMTFSSNSSGQVHQEPKEGTRWVSVYNIVRCWCVHGPVAVARELILDEHVECGCKCGPGEIKMLLLQIHDYWRSSPIHG